ncbi:hypothetical protein G9A89_003872 [Geosiphon pyriformis]|nr:hypothetical protein G9A89_003872 [Geosiphon pyriformis]
MNTQSIALIETACKILSKILLNRISLVCSTFDVLHGDNFLVLRGMTIQSPIFAIGSVVEDALEKGCELWLVLQDMWKAYDSVEWEHLQNSLTVTIPINCKVADLSLLISRSSISIAKKEKLHYYLGIYLLTEGLFKPSLAKAYSDVQFFANLVLKKAVSDKQFLYLVLVVFFPIIGYRTQFSYIPVNVCKKWDALIHKGLKSKSGLLYDFPSDAIHYSSLYSLKTFEQIQAENKLASVISFANSIGILGRLFSHQSHDLQVLCWCPFYSLQYLVHVKVNFLNNFLAGIVCIFSESNLFLGSSLTNAFHHRSRTSMSCVLGESTYFKCVSSLWHYGIAFIDQLLDQSGAIFDWKTFKQWKWLNLHGSVPVWFELSVWFFSGASSLSVYSLPLDDGGSLNILYLCGFSAINANLLCSDVGHLSVYTDGSLSGLGSVNMKARAAVFFEDISMDLDVGVSGLMSSTLTELQVIALVLECIPLFCSIDLFSNSQAALDACKLELNLVHLDYRNQYWIECCHIHADKVDGTAISGNSRYFVQDVFQSVHYAHWEISSGSWVVVNSLCVDIDWFRSLLVWHPDSHMAAGFTSKQTAGFWTYFMKALHLQLSVAV